MTNYFWGGGGHRRRAKLTVHKSHDTTLALDLGARACAWACVFVCDYFTLNSRSHIPVLRNNERNDYRSI
jgi:hypothetical protein